MKKLKELIDLSERVALITGGGGYIGKAFAETLAEMGATVVLLDADVGKLEEVGTHVRKCFNARVETLHVDLEDQARVREIPGMLQDKTGRLDVLVNNAAFGASNELEGWVVRFEDQSPATWRRALEVNLIAAFELAQGCAKMLAKTGRGSVVNVASIYGIAGPDMRLYEGTDMGNPAAYAASKGGLIQMTRWLATVMAPRVRVNTLSPGGVYRGQSEAFLERYVVRTPLGRMATEEDMKGALAYLASDLSGYMTGHNLVVDGGWTAW